MPLWCKVIWGLITTGRPLLDWPGLLCPQILHLLSYPTAFPKWGYWYFEDFMISVQRNILKTGKLQLQRKAPASLPSDTHDTLHFVLLPWHWISPWSIRHMNTCQVIAVRINQESIFNDYDFSPLIFSFQANGCAFFCWTLTAARPQIPRERTFELSSSFLWTTSCGHFPGQFPFPGKGPVTLNDLCHPSMPEFLHSKRRTTAAHY